MNRQMKESHVEWIKEIPSTWEVLRIKNVLQERKEKNDPIKTTEILSLTMDKGVIPYGDKKSGGNIAKEDLSAYKLAYPNDIVLNSMNIIAGSVGLSNYFGCVSPVYYTLFPKHEGIYINFYNFLFQSTAFQRSLIGLGNGIMIKESHVSGKLNTIRMRIPMGRLNNVSVPVPSLSEQINIASFLTQKVSQIDSIIDDTKESIKEFKKYKQSLVTESITKGVKEDAEMIGSGIEWIGEMPKHWQAVKTKRLFYIKKNIANEEGHPILSVTQQGLKIKDISKNEGQIATNYSKYQFVNIGDFVMNHMDLLTGWVDNSEFEGVTSPDYRVFRMKDSSKYLNEYYKYILQACYSNRIYYGLGQGVSNLGRWRLQTDKFLNFVLPVPPLSEQRQIVEYLNEKCAHIDSLIEQKQQLLIELETYKKSFIYEYVTGKKEVF